MKSELVKGTFEEIIKVRRRVTSPQLGLMHTAILQLCTTSKLYRPVIWHPYKTCGPLLYLLYSSNFTVVLFSGASNMNQAGTKLDMLRYSLRKSVLLEVVLYLEHQMEPVQQHIELAYIEPVRQCMENVWPLRPCSHVMVCHFTASE